MVFFVTFVICMKTAFTSPLSFAKCCALAALWCVGVAAQCQPTGQVLDDPWDRPWDKHVFNHLSVGLNAGLLGVGPDVAMPVCRYVQLRAGFLLMPRLGLNARLSPSGPAGAGLVDVKVQTKLFSAMLMMDVLPLRHSPFHFTLGLMLGTPDVVEVHNREPGSLLEMAQANAGIAEWNALHPASVRQPQGLLLGQQLLMPDAQGNVEASLGVRRLRPYVGVGYGRSVPHRRVGFQVQLGCAFWGEPTVQVGGQPVQMAVEHSRQATLLRTLTRWQVYPCLNLRLCGRVF